MKTKSPSSILALALAAIIALIVAPTMQAALTGTAGYSLPTAPTVIGGNYNLGLEFAPGSNFDISALGYWDDIVTNFPHDGLYTSHQVAIYYAQDYLTFHAGDLVTGALVTVQVSDSGAALDIGNNPNGWYSYHALDSNITLVAGVHYRISGMSVGYFPSTLTMSTADGNSYHNPHNQTNIADITVFGGVGGSNPGGVNIFYPGGAVDTNNYYYNANFLVAVPEPGSLALLSIGGLAFVSWRLRRGIRKSS
ncbi:MAG: PEP-CTERM sorting domain-containing protein [Chthoniobacterales bacterium]